MNQGAGKKNRCPPVHSLSDVEGERALQQASRLQCKVPCCLDHMPSKSSGGRGIRVDKDTVWSPCQAPVEEECHTCYGFWSKAMPSAAKNYSLFEKQHPACWWALTIGHQMPKASELLIMSWILYHSGPTAAHCKIEVAHLGLDVSRS